jgi:hypothetical protein
VTDPQGFADAVRRFSTDLDAAVVRARRVASEARETSAKFRGQTRELADAVRSGAAKVAPGQLTDGRLRRTASGFRTDNGLPVRDLPSGPELVDRPVATPVPPPHASTTPGPSRTAGSGRAVPPPGDDDEDFSQDQIMR